MEDSFINCFDLSRNNLVYQKRFRDDIEKYQETIGLLTRPTFGRSIFHGQKQNI